LGYSVSAGTLPAGLTLATDGTLSGTPTVAGASSFTITVNDSSATPQTVSLSLILQVTYPSGSNNSQLDGHYAFLFQGYDDAAAGLLAYRTASAGSFSVDGNGLVTGGVIDENHQGSNPTGNTILSTPLVGSYQVNADNRGFITLTTLNPDGTPNTSHTYAIALAAPASGTTTSAQATITEHDDDALLSGTRGSGTILAQNTTAVSQGLSGSYAFGLEGDTPCLPTCALNLVGGPVAQVGVFMASGGTISNGLTDANIGATVTANSPLTGNYMVTPDANGRVPLTLNTVDITPAEASSYPTDYVAYVVDANRAFLVSTDKHSSFILLSGTAQLQTQSAFSNASINGGLVGYENAITNPGLLGTTLQNVANLSTATIFQEGGSGNGNCNINSVDTGGTSSLVSGLTGILGSLTGLNALLGAADTTGAATCAVAVNGRGVLAYSPPSGLIAIILQGLGLSTGLAPRVAYLTAPNQGYFLETGYAALGHIEAQTSTTVSLADLTGTYTYGTVTPSSAVSTNTSGVFTADGAGNQTQTVDLSLGVGSINLLQLGVASSGTYTLSSPASLGRFRINNVNPVLYEIAPNRFVLVDTSALVTSPAVNILQK